MKKSNIVDLADFRQFFGIWQKVRDRIAAGRTKGLFVSILDEDESETILLAGRNTHDADLALRAALRVRTHIQEEERPKFKNSKTM